MSESGKYLKVNFVFLVVILSRTPLLRDPYEEETVFVAPSNIPFAGEGLFARRKIRINELVCLFNGIRCDKPERAKIIHPESDEWSDYRLTLGMVITGVNSSKLL